ncbi:MAG: glycosyltransferase family 39 protein [Candidatus Methylopumilus sp.]|nr:glycosyltransferase family 39 protein [Candidatus Methylopumilus sp.]
MLKKNHFNAFVILVTGLYLLFALYGLHFYPIDETRYMSVAWDMWLRQDYLVPHLNGLPYSHKPPLLFWLINLGWHFFGVNDWWPRTIPFLFSLASIFLVKKIADKLWKKNKNIGYISIFLLLGSSVWAVFSVVLMFDMMLTFFTCLGIFGMVVSLKEKNKNGFIYLALAFGGGLLAKGPTIILQILPLALLAPWWIKQKSIQWKSWYMSFAIAFLVGVGMLLTWAIPAGISGGNQYQHDIFWGQTANRMIHSFAHNRPQWWYLEIAPFILFPLLFVPVFWGAVIQSPAKPLDEGFKFALAWFLPVFIIFSLISGKQIQYLLPIYPALSFLIASQYDNIKKITPYDNLAITLILMVSGGALYFLITSHPVSTEVPWVKFLPNQISFIPIFIGLILLAWFVKDKFLFLWKLVITNIVVMFMIFVGVIDHSGNAYDLRAISHELKKLETQEISLAYLGKYAGQFDFSGKLTKPVQSLNNDELFNWANSNPKGAVVVIFGDKPGFEEMKVLYNTFYRGGYIAILSSRDINRICKPQPRLCVTN